MVKMLEVGIIIPGQIRDISEVCQQVIWHPLVTSSDLLNHLILEQVSS